MARPLKEGLEYRPVSVTRFKDRRAQRILKRAGAAAYLALEMIIDDIVREHGYYLDIDADYMEDLEDLCGVDPENIGTMMDICFRDNLFDKEIHDQYQILTSKEIQLLYLTMTRRRKKLKVINEIWLLSNADMEAAEETEAANKLITVPINVDNNPVNAYHNPVNVDNNGKVNAYHNPVNACHNPVNVDNNPVNAYYNPVNVDNSTQRKVKKNRNTKGNIEKEAAWQCITENMDKLYYENEEEKEHNHQCLIADGKEHGPEIVAEALKAAVSAGDDKGVSYYRGVLRNKLDGK